MGKGIKIYYFSIFLMMCAVYSLSFTWSIHVTVFETFSAICSILFYFSNPHHFSRSKKKDALAILLLIWYLYSSIISPNFFAGFIQNALVAVCTCVLIYSSTKIKLELFSFISRGTAIILLISLVAWLLYLTGIPLPHRDIDEFRDGFHTYVDYYFFLLPQREYFELLPRFSSVFIEPGQMASVCTLLLLSNLSLKGFKSNKFDIIIFSISIILSFSLAGWLVALFALIVNNILLKSKNILKALLKLGIVSFVIFFSVSRISEESEVGHYIIERIAYDENTIISGYNRTNDDFEVLYDSFIRSEDAFWGIHKQLIGEKNWTRGNSGYKVFIVVNGLIGFFIIIILGLLCILLFPNSQVGLMICVWFVLGAIRSFWPTPYWLYIILLSVFLLQQQKEAQNVE